MTYKILPRGKWILVKPVALEARSTKSGLILPANDEKEQKAQGSVEAVGDQISDIKKGDMVIYGAYAGEDLSISDGKGKEIIYKLLVDEDVIAFLK